jgi:secretion/DNA translocation related TadE-like protein
MVVAVIGLIVMVSTGALLLVGAVEASHRARLAADLAALAGAASARSEGSTAAGCSQAAAVAVSNRADLTGCSFRGADIEVTVTTRVRWGPGEAIARAAAGPAPHAPR